MLEGYRKLSTGRTHCQCKYLMRVVSDNIVDEYDCLYDSVPTNPQKLIKELTKHETKLKSTSKSASDLRFGPPSEG